MISQIRVPEAESETHISTKINRGVAWTAASQTIVAIADLLSQAFVVAQWMSKFEFGIVMAAVPLYSILDAAADLGVTSALIQRDDHTPERVSTVFWFNVLLSFGLFALLCIGGPLYARLQGYSVVELAAHRVRRQADRRRTSMRSRTRCCARSSSSRRSRRSARSRT